VHRICPAICGTQLRAVGYSRCSGCTQPHDTALFSFRLSCTAMAAAVRSIMQFDAVLLGAVGVHLANPNDPHVCGVADGVSPAHRISSRETALPSTPTHRRPTPLPRVYVRACVHRVARVCTPTSAHICILAPSCHLAAAASTARYAPSARTCARQDSRATALCLPGVADDHWPRGGRRPHILCAQGVGAASAALLPGEAALIDANTRCLATQSLPLTAVVSCCWQHSLAASEVLRCYTLLYAIVCLWATPQQPQPTVPSQPLWPILRRAWLWPSRGGTML
jgi:hypothetical protein